MVENADSNLRIPIVFATSRYGWINGNKSTIDAIIVTANVAKYFFSLNPEKTLKSL